MAVSLTAVNRGTIPGDNTGDTPYVAFGKVNDNDDALKTAVDKVLDLSQNTILGRITASTGDPEHLTAAQVRTILNVEDGATADQTGAEIDSLLDTQIGHSNWTIDWTADQGATNIDYRNLTQFDSTNQGVVPGSGGGTTNFLRADGTWAAPSGGMTQLSDDTTPALGGNLAVGSYELQSTTSIVTQLGDAAGTYKFSVQDSNSTEQFSVNSDGEVTLKNKLTMSFVEISGLVMASRDNVNAMTWCGGSSTSNGASIVLYSSGNALANDVNIATASNATILYYDYSETLWDFQANDLRTGGDLLFDVNGAGIDWSNAQTSTTATGASTTSEVLDHYEEGTWTPVLTDGTNNASMLYQTGYYVRIGRLVYFTALVGVDGMGSCSGNMYIDQLPFTTSANGFGSMYVGNLLNLNITAGESVTGYVNSSDDRITLMLWDDTGGTTNMQASEFTANSYGYISGTYVI